ncbi:MAG TPA: hypothetical protein VF079_00615 [Sphingomicrobium sp.]
MSIGTLAIADAALGEQEEAAAAKEKVPRKRQLTAKGDVVAQPEAR